MTLTSDKWKVGENSGGWSESAPAIADSLDVLLPTAKLLAKRGYTDPESASRFLKKSTEMLHDPFKMKDMERAASRIIDAANTGESITIYGD